jgi:membrane-associated protein
MESILFYICENAYHAHWIIFCLLLLAGLNVPISEDIMLIGGGAIASTCIPDHAVRLFIWIFLGCYISAWEAYWIGRLLGPKLYDIRLFNHIITPHRMDVLRHYYAKFGVFTFIVGRFCPGGIRNALFMSSGLTKMPFSLFILRDGIACFISSNVLFQIGYKLGENVDVFLPYVKKYSEGFLLIVVTLTLLGFGYSWYKHTYSKENR